MPGFKIGTYEFYGEQIGYLGDSEGEIAIFLIPDMGRDRFLVVYEIFGVAAPALNTYEELAGIQTFLSVVKKYVKRMALEDLMSEAQIRHRTHQYYEEFIILGNKNKQPPTIINKVVVI